MFSDFEVISSYSRAEAIEDGTLVDVTETAREAGFRFPVAITAGVYDALAPTPADTELGQSFSGRLWDMLNMLRHSIKRSGASSELEFSVLVWRNRYGNKAHSEIYNSVCGPGDNGEAVITIMLPGED